MKMMSPWCVTFRPQPASLSAGAAYQRSWKLGGVPGVPPVVQVGIGPNTCRVIAFDCVTPFTVYWNVPLLESAKDNVAVPTWVRFAPVIGVKGTALNAGPVVR